MIDNGHRNIAFIGSSYIPEYYIQAFTGYKKALEEIQVSIPSNWIQINAKDEESSYECMANILRSNNSVPTAVFCAGDIFAIGAIRCAKEFGYKVPDDISFVGIDDIILSRYVEPKLTTVKIDKALMGSLAMELIVKKINGEQVKSEIVESDNLIIRDSVKCLKG